jgi:hypothetical protein
MDMLKHWQELFNTDCKVVKVKNRYVYPIFKCGSSSFFKDAKQVIKNEKIEKLKTITVLIREPKERFMAGVVTYADLVKRSTKDVMKDIKADKLCNRHFAPQFVWLMQLHMHYKGEIEIKPFAEIKKYTNTKTLGSLAIKEKITPLKNYIAVDQKLIKKFMNKKVSLSKIQADLIDNVLS